LIRPVVRSDLEAVYSIHTEDQVNQYLPYDTWQQWPDALAWFERVEERRRAAEAEQFVILRVADQQLVGTCIVFDFDVGDLSCEFGYVLHRDRWGNGYMIEACRVLIDALLSMRDLEAIRAVVKSENKASLNLLSKLGFELIYTEPNEQGHTADERVSGTIYLRLG